MLGGMHPCCVFSGGGLYCGWLTRWVHRREQLIFLLPASHSTQLQSMSPVWPHSQPFKSCPCHKVCMTAGHHVDAFPVFPPLPPLWEYHSNPDMRKSSNTRMVGFFLAKSFYLNSCMENLPLVLGHAQEWEKEELEFVRLWVSSWFLLGLWQSSPSEPVWENATQSPFLKSQLPFQCKSNCSLPHFCGCCGEGHPLLQVLSISI